MGMAKMGPNVRWGIRGGFYALQETHKEEHTRNHEIMNQETKKPRTRQTPRSTLLRGPLVEVTPLLQHYPSCCISLGDKYKVLLELYPLTMVRT